MKFVDDRYSSGLNTSVTFYEIYWLVNRSRDKLVRCQSAYCFESGKMPFVYVERSNDSISVFDSKCSRLYRRDTFSSLLSFIFFPFFLSLSFRNPFSISPFEAHFGLFATFTFRFGKLHVCKW